MVKLWEILQKKTDFVRLLDAKLFREIEPGIFILFQLDAFLFNTFDSKHAMNSAYHPYTNDQDEITNQTLIKH